MIVEFRAGTGTAVKQLLSALQGNCENASAGCVALASRYVPVLLIFVDLFGIGRKVIWLCRLLLLLLLFLWLCCRKIFGRNAFLFSLSKPSIAASV